MNTQSDKQDEVRQTHAEQVRVFKHDLNKVAKQKYVTIAQFKEIKRRADKLSTKHDSKSVDTVVDKFDKTDLVDDKTGFVYLANVCDGVGGGDFITGIKGEVEFSLKQVKNDNSGYVDPAWDD